MNGKYVRTYQATATRSVTVYSLVNGQKLAVEKGDKLTIVEDSYGNTYVDGEPVDFADLPEPVQCAILAEISTWYAG